MTPKYISSLQNPLIKQVILLGGKSRERRKQGLFVAEGLREVGLAFANGFRARAVFFDAEVTEIGEIEALGNHFDETILVPPQVFEKLAYRAKVPNVVALCYEKAGTEKDFVFETTTSTGSATAPLVLILEGIEKPGNLGAILRTADALGVDGVILCDPQLDKFNPNVIRASLGAVFAVPMVVMSASEALAYCTSQRFQIMTTWLGAKDSLYDADFTGAVAFVLGAEADGVSDFWVEKADKTVIIPMQGQVDSLNLSASAAIVLSESIRQRSATF